MARDKQIEKQGPCFKDQECDDIGLMGDSRTEQQKRGRIIKEIILYTFLGRSLLSGIVRRLIVGELRCPGVRQASCGIKADEICAGRPRKWDDQAMSAGSHKQKNSNFDGKQYAATNADTIPVEQSARQAHR